MNETDVSTAQVSSACPVRRRPNALADGLRAADVVAKVEKANAGYKAVSVWADMETSGAKAEVNLLKGTESKHVEDKL